MDTAHARKLLDTDLDGLVARASSPAATLEALAAKVSGAIDELGRYVAEAGVSDADVAARLERERATLAKLDGIVAKARADGRPDLEAAAAGRQAQTRATLASLEARAAGGGPSPDDAQRLLEQLEERHADILARVEHLSLSMPGDDVALGELGTEPPAPVRGAPRPASAGEGGDALDDEFASFLAEMGETVTVSPVTAKAPAKDDDMMVLPDLVEVGEGELPEGESEDDFDFSAIDALAAREAGKPAPKPAKAKGKPAPVPAVAKAPSGKALSASAKPAGGASDAEDGKGGRTALWVGLGLAAAGGGTVAVLAALGVL